MLYLNLAGEWLLTRDDGDSLPGHLPGCTYLDYMARGMDDPFWDMNETEANLLAHHDYCYSRKFTVTQEMLGKTHLVLVGDGLDTLCTLSINGKLLGKTDNVNRVWRFDVRSFCVPGENEIKIEIADPYKFIEEMQKKDELPRPATPIAGVGYLRKSVYNFGWDWGPKLPPAGVTREIAIEAYDFRIDEVLIRQHHHGGTVTLEISDKVEDGKNLDHRLSITDPDGNITEYSSEDGKWNIDIKDPQLWWCNGLGDQPLYKLRFSVTDGSSRHEITRQIGLRTIELDTSADEHGRQFRFIINGVPIFARGANWIPADSFITRITQEMMDWYMDAAKRANMNMLRVWGGGIFETEEFYNACDRCGILVWQDHLFCDNPYPFYNEEFLANIHEEIKDNVRRLRHRASLALWCGNNENEVFALLWKKHPKILDSNMPFYHNTLRQWTDELDGVTPYWPGSPSSGALDEKVHNLEEGHISGDTHLWHIWHGMRKIEAFREFPTRFCSEFGMESMPSLHTISMFTDKPDPQLFDPVMMLHQKSSGGNEKMLYYLLAKYRNPKKFEDFVYLSQLVQSDTIRFATDHWRRNIGRQNGSLFWQINDCWPVASWAGIDYGRQQKAIMYQVRHFNKMLSLSNDYFDDKAEIYITNEYPSAFTGRLEWKLISLAGREIDSSAAEVTVPAVSSVKAVSLKFREVLHGHDKKDAAMLVTLSDGSGVRDEKSWLLVEDKRAKLSAISPTVTCTADNGRAEVTLSCDSYARYVELSAEGVTGVWSDNYFDIIPGTSVTVSVELPDGMTADEFRSKLKIRTLADVEPGNSRLIDKWLRFKMVMKNHNYLSWFVFKFLLS